jgi:hypothetical protein
MSLNSRAIALQGIGLGLALLVAVQGFTPTTAVSTAAINTTLSVPRAQLAGQQTTTATISAAVPVPALQITGAQGAPPLYTAADTIVPATAQDVTRVKADSTDTVVNAAAELILVAGGPAETTYILAQTVIATYIAEEDTLIVVDGQAQERTIEKAEEPVYVVRGATDTAFVLTDNSVRYISHDDVSVMLAVADGAVISVERI